LAGATRTSAAKTAPKNVEKSFIAAI